MANIVRMNSARVDVDKSALDVIQRNGSVYGMNKIRGWEAIKNTFLVLSAFLFIAAVFIVPLLVIGAYNDYEYHQRLAQGWILTTSWDCPANYPIKANSRSMIYHLPGDPYYSRTDAANGECFDTPQHAVAQGFRPIYR